MHNLQRPDWILLTGNTRSVNGHTFVEVVFLCYDSLCFMIIAPFVLEVAETRIKVVHSSLILGRESLNQQISAFAKLLFSRLPAVCAALRLRVDWK